VTASDREAYWRKTFAGLHAQPHDHVDYATAEEQAFTFGACLLAAGAVAGRRCLDAGCGKGGFARILHALGGVVVGIDFIDATMHALQRSDPGIRWESGSACDAAAITALGPFDRVFAIEILQCVPPGPLFQSLWSAVAPDGRLIGVTPNADNPFVRRRSEERPGLYAPLGTTAIIEHLRALPGVADLGVMGFAWRQDRGSVLYDLLPLTSTPQWEEPPKRLLFLARKAATNHSERPVRRVTP
jgi:2-polyprenyl-3-methyl-5-hydroxy-6-metoxy-1,4-benzoquinol methylase